MIMRKGEIRTPHFAHKHIDFDHGGETPLHYNTKILLFEFIQRSLTNKNPTFVTFECECSETHSINLLEDVTDVYLEKQVTEIYRPDISIYCGNTFKMAIEVIVTHDLEAEALSYLKQHDIPFLKINTTPELYSNLIQKYRTNTPELLELSNDVEIEGISILDYCNNNVRVTYYPNLKNIFPCFGYHNINESTTSSERDISEGSPFDRDFRAKIDDGILPCNTCKYFHTKLSPTEISCKNPLGKRNVFREWDHHLTPSIFKFDKYYKSGKKHREDGDYREIAKIIESHKSLEFFEYEVFDYVFSDCAGRYMKVYKNGEWIEPTRTEILMKQVFFRCGKHNGKSLEDVYKNDLGYLHWILLKRPDGIYFEEVIEVLDKMKNKGWI